MRPVIEKLVEIIGVEYDGFTTVICPACLLEAKERVMRRMRLITIEVPKAPEEIDAEILMLSIKEVPKELKGIVKRFRITITTPMIDAERRMKEAKRRADFMIALEDWFVATGMWTREEAEKAADELWKKLVKKVSPKIKRKRVEKLPIPKGLKYFFHCPVGHTLDIRKGTGTDALVSPSNIVDEIRKVIPVPLPFVPVPPPPEVRLRICPYCGAKVLPEYLQKHMKICPKKPK